MFQRAVERTLFDLACGIYTSILATVVVTLLTSTHYFSRISLITVCFGFLCGVFLAVVRDDLAELLVRTRLYLILLIGPFFVYLISDVVTVVSTNPDLTVLQNWIAGALLLTIAGFFLSITTMNYYTVILRRHEEVLTEWFGRPDSSYLRFVRLLSIVGGLIFLVGGFILHISIESLQGLFPSIGGVLLGNAIVIGKTKHYTLVESGLLVKRSGTFNNRFIPRHQLRSVECNGDVLTIHRGFPWPLPFRCRLALIPDSESVVHSLQKYVDEN
ncbi:hypothetical protein [Haladaptatus sp. CMAA 1911]|uniref:hypothetical protein n=1 Tax=unclassified Haladaptatus TaxID=2622732 RepID=UPI0037544F5D